HRQRIAEIKRETGVSAKMVETGKELITAKSQVAELTASLNALIGFAPDTQLQLAPPEPITEEISSQAASQRALVNSPEVVEAEQTVAKARAATRLTKFDYVPDVGIVGGYAVQTIIPALPHDFSYIGVIATFNIFDFGKREKTISERRTQL